jgi:multidrug efflux pump subunit AcrB
VAKNGILLVDFANQAQARGRHRATAIREAAAERFRPIIMTTFAMVFGMLPLALDPGGQQRSALGVVIIGGLLSSFGTLAPGRAHRLPGAAPAGGPGRERPRPVWRG